MGHDRYLQVLCGKAAPFFATGILRAAAYPREPGMIALVGMANTLSLSVLERTRESALLRALGLTRQGLRSMISMEAVLLGLMGAVAGVAFGVGFGSAMSKAFLGADGGPVSYPILQITGYLALAAVAALLASVVPARRAARLTVIDGLSEE